MIIICTHLHKALTVLYICISIVLCHVYDFCFILVHVPDFDVVKNNEKDT